MAVAEKALLLAAEQSPCLPFIHSLSRRGIEIHVGSHKRICSGFFSRFVAKRYMYPCPFEDEGGFVESILDVLKKGNFKVSFVFGDQVTFLVTKYKSEFDKYTILPINEFDTYIKCRCKKNTLKCALRARVPVPKSWFPDEQDIEAIAREVTYQVVLKPNVSVGARGISYPKRPEELIDLYRKTKDEYGECHVQEFVPPGGGQYKAEILLNNELELVSGCVYEKVRYYPPKGGSSTFMQTVYRPDILDTGHRILNEIGWVGVGDCDFILDPRDNTPKLMEINSRITRSIKICVLAGVDFPYQLYRLAIGEKVKRNPAYKVPIHMRYLLADILWLLKSNGTFSNRLSFFKDIFGEHHEEIFSIEDPFPFLGFSLERLLDMLDKDSRKWRLR